MTSNSMMMSNTNSTSNNTQVNNLNEVVCTPTLLFPTFSGLDARQTLSGFLTTAQVPVCNNHTQPIIKFTKTQQKNQSNKNDSSTQTSAQLISSALNQQNTLTNHTITIQHQPIQNTHLMQNGQKSTNHFTQNATIMIPTTNSSQLKSNHLTNYQTEIVTPWTCPSCKLPCKSAAELQSHLNIHIQNAAIKTASEKTVPCEQCGKLFASQERVKIHFKVAHGTKSSTCHICGSSFSYKCKLADHMRTHTGEKPFPCETCGRRFSQKNHLRRHKMIHSGEKPFPCETCGKGFYRKDKLSRHRLIHLNPSSRKNKQTQLNNQNNQNNNNENNSLNALNSNGSWITGDLIGSNALANSNSLFQTNSTNDNLLTSSGTTTIQLIPVHVTQQCISTQNMNSHPNEEQMNGSNGANV